MIVLLYGDENGPGAVTADLSARQCVALDDASVAVYISVADVVPVLRI